MLSKTRGIVLHHIKYSETSIIAYIYTEQHGRQNYLIPGARKKNAKIRANLFQPLSILDLEAYYKPTGNLQKIKEAGHSTIFESIPVDHVKRTMALFMAEILYRSLKEEEGNPVLFDFLQQFIVFLDQAKKQYHHLHIFFLIELSRYLGFYPSNNYSGGTPYFDLANGEFKNQKPVHNHYLVQPLTGTLHEFMHSAGNHVQARDKFSFLEKLIDYYKLHLEGMGDIKSLMVLKDVFHDR